MVLYWPNLYQLLISVRIRCQRKSYFSFFGDVEFEIVVLLSYMWLLCLSYAADWRCDPKWARIVPLLDGEIRAFFGDIFFIVGCKRLRSFKKSEMTRFKYIYQKKGLVFASNNRKNVEADMRKENGIEKWNENHTSSFIQVNLPISIDFLLKSWIYE